MSANFHIAKKDKTALVKPDISHNTELTDGIVSNRSHDPAWKRARFGAIGPEGRKLAQYVFEMTADETQRFLRIILNVSQIRNHYELFLMLQGEIQHFISHQILIAAWGDFRDSKLTLDVVSALPGVRTGKVNGCGSEVERMIEDLYAHWIANGRRKMLLNRGRFKSITSSLCDCALHKSMRGMQSILVHGVHDERDQTDSIYVALDSNSVLSGQSIERFFPLISPLIAQIDVAFQRIGALKSVGATGIDDSSSRANLSEREWEIMKWVADGRTNVEIGSILGISSFTVKNHLQHIFKNLRATNRAEAVSKCNQVGFRV